MSVSRATVAAMLLASAGSVLAAEPEVGISVARACGSQDTDVLRLTYRSPLAPRDGARWWPQQLHLGASIWRVPDLGGITRRFDLNVTPVWRSESAFGGAAKGYVEAGLGSTCCRTPSTTTTTACRVRWSSAPISAPECSSTRASAWGSPSSTSRMPASSSPTAASTSTCLLRATGCSELVEDRHRHGVVGVEPRQHEVAERALEDQRRQDVAQAVPAAVVDQRVLRAVGARRHQDAGVVEPGLLLIPACGLFPGREVLRRRIRVEIIEEEDAATRVVHRADALRIACGDDIDMPGVLAHIRLERPEAGACAQRFDPLDRVGLDQQRDVEARAMEPVAAPAQERRCAERRDEDRLERYGLAHAQLPRDAGAPGRAVLDHVPLRAARPEERRMRIHLRGEKQVPGV